MVSRERLDIGLTGRADVPVKGGARIVLATIGTLGDLHPFIAIGLALRAHGHDPVLAVPADHVDKVRSTGLEAVAIMPAFEDIRRTLGLDEDSAVKRVMADQRYMLERVVLPWLESSTDALDRACAGAEALVASLFVFGAATVAEKRGIPLASTLLQPMALLSPHRPPHTPDFWMMKGEPTSWAGVSWNRLVFAAGRVAFRRRYGPIVDRVRASHGLASGPDRTLIDIARVTRLTIGCYSPTFGEAPPDAPTNARIVGFPFYDATSGAHAAADPELDAFLDAGTAPLVFTLGSFAVHAPGDFYREAAAAARLLGQRAILLTGPGSRMQSDPQILVRDYAPHSTLFPRALAVIHHGGVGTTGQALRAGRPQLVVPHMGDQWDNGHRIKQMGVGRVLRARRFTADRAARRIATLIDPQRSFIDRAAQVGAIVAAEQGADNAVRAIEAMMAAVA